MHRAGYKVEKSSVRVKKKSKIAYNLFAIKAKYFLHFLTILAFFSTLPGTQTFKVIGLIFFNELALHNWAINMHFSLYLLFKAFFYGGAWAARLYIDTDPPAFTVLKLLNFF